MVNRSRKPECVYYKTTIRFSSLLAAARLATATLSAQAGDISVTDPYARAVPPGQPNSAVFMALVNNSKENQVLVAAETPSAGVVELHTLSMRMG